jgi:hypothetical protein
MSGFGGNACWKSTWDFAGSQNAQNLDAKLLPSGKHGATTENTKDTLTLLLKMVLTEFWSKVGM